METNIKQVVFRGLRFDAWYPCTGYFEPGLRLTKHNLRQVSSTLLTGLEPDFAEVRSVDLMHVCEWCFKYSIRQDDVQAHQQTCRYKRKLPGRLVYRDDNYAIRKVSGQSEHKLFCQCMCLFGKLFLDSKSILYSIEGFDFYVLSETGDGKHPLGFFSRERNSWDNFNLACLVVFPPYQQKGLGLLLIAFSYYLYKIDGKQGSPEKPLSKYGHASYMRYWCTVVAGQVTTCKGSRLSIEDIMAATAMTSEDITACLMHMGALEPGNSQRKQAKLSTSKIQAWVARHKLSLKPVLDESSCLV